MNGSEKVTALIVEDHEMISEMLQERLTLNGFQVVGVAANADEGFALYGRHRPDLVLCDVRLARGSSGIDLTRLLVTTYPLVRVLMVSAEEGRQAVADSLEAGAVGFVSKTASTAELLLALKEAMAGMTNVADRRTYRKLIETLNVPSAPADVRLTPREQEVVNLLARGVTTTAALQNALLISANSVRSHIDNIMHKVDAHSRAEIVAKAYQLALVQLPLS